MIRRCDASDFDAILGIINDAAQAYRGVIAEDCFPQPYMPGEELRAEIESGVAFWGFEEYRGERGELASVMGLQHVADVALIRHAYTRTARRNSGIGTLLLEHLRRQSDRPMLVGTWRAATWAVGFYEKRGFRMVAPEQAPALLRRYWRVPERQIEESVVLAQHSQEENAAERRFQ
jgi:N-acetylglutamate synthase-like GNAT family acetyltransferase